MAQENASGKFYYLRGILSPKFSLRGIGNSIHDPTERDDGGMIDDPESIGLRLRDLRVRAGLKQIDVARAIGVTRGHVGLVENGRTGLILPRLQAWVELCGGTMSEFFLAGDEGSYAHQMLMLPDDLRQLVERMIDIVGAAPAEDIAFLDRLFAFYERDIESTGGALEAAHVDQDD